MGFILRIIAYGLAAVVAAYAVHAVNADWFSFETNQQLALFGLAMGVINWIIKPVAKFITLPLSCLTFGLFAFVVNAALFWLGAQVVDGTTVTWQGALFGSILASLAGGVIFSVLDDSSR